MGCGSSGSLEVDLDKDILDRSPSDEALDSGRWLLLTSFWDRDLGRPPGLTTTSGVNGNGFATVMEEAVASLWICLTTSGSSGT